MVLPSLLDYRNPFYDVFLFYFVFEFYRIWDSIGFCYVIL